ncbi:MAG: PAAR domain-containing protein [Anaerolineae bacterium]|nr:PAAR domain-containing protein [Anaerolineae bacterium]
MGQPAAKQGDKITATDTHTVIVPGSPPVKTDVPLPFSGALDGNLSSDVKIMGKAAAVVGSTASNSPAHIPPSGASFQSPPSNKGTITTGSSTVFINGKAAARNGDTAETCNDPKDLPVGKVVATGTVMIG